MSLDLNRLADACARVAAPTYEPGLEGSFRPFRRDDLIYYTNKIQSALSGTGTKTLEDVFRLFAYRDPDGLVPAAYVIREYLPQNFSPTSHDSLKVEASEIKVYPGDLVVKGDIENGGIILVLGKLTVDDAPSSCNRLSSAEDTLWSVGADDVFCFDGTEWTRID